MPVDDLGVEEVDHVVCAITPERFYAVGAWYKDFSQTTDEEVRELLDEAAKRLPADRQWKTRTMQNA